MWIAGSAAYCLVVVVVIVSVIYSLPSTITRHACVAMFTFFVLRLYCSCSCVSFTTVVLLTFVGV